MAWGEPAIVQLMDHFYRLELLRKAWARYCDWSGLGWPAPEKEANTEPPSKEAE